MGETELSVIVLSPDPQLVTLVPALHCFFNAEKQFLLHVQLVYAQHVLHVLSLHVPQSPPIHSLGTRYLDEISKSDAPEPYSHLLYRPLLYDLYVSLDCQEEIIVSEDLHYLLLGQMMEAPCCEFLHPFVHLLELNYQTLMMFVDQKGFLVSYCDTHYVLGAHTDQEVCVGLDIECNQMVLVVGGLVEGCIDVATVVKEIIHQELPALVRIFKQEYGIVERHMHALDGDVQAPLQFSPFLTDIHTLLIRFPCAHLSIYSQQKQFFPFTPDLLHTTLYRIDGFLLAIDK